MSANDPRCSGPRVAVIGGGVSGLTAAWELTRRAPQAAVTLLESGDRLGGVLQTEHRDGFTLELGPDSFLRRLPYAIGLCQSLGLGEEIIPTDPAAAGTYTVYRGRLLKMPEGLAAMAPRRIWPMIRTPLLSPAGKVRMGAERFLPRRRADGDESLAQFARRRFGREALERIIQPLAGGIYMGDPELLGMQAAFPQLLAAERECGSLIRSTRQAAARAAKTPPAPGDTLFAALRRGFGQLVEALCAHLPAGTIRTGQRVESITRCDGAWRVAGRGDGQQFAESFDQVIVAAPARHAGAMLADADAELADLLRGIPTTSCVVVNAAYARDEVPHPLDAAGVIVPHVEGRPIAACTFSSVKYRGRAPAGMVLLRAFLGGAARPELIDASDEEISRLVSDELRHLLGATAAPRFTRIARWRDAMPQYYVGHLERVAQVEARAAALPQLELAGNAYRGVGIPHCIHGAQQAVQRLLAEAPTPIPS
ncbi:MAG: protoporphyrinogen oxidase [Planctomycetales bacterium]|nr:protoporphyrinogen oxidase [Planctomycetales bacterium]